jgi:hypothetical protein
LHFLNHKGRTFLPKTEINHNGVKTLSKQSPEKCRFFFPGKFWWGSDPLAQHFTFFITNSEKDNDPFADNQEKPKWSQVRWKRTTENAIFWENLARK